MSSQFNPTIDYARHLLRRNGCKAHVSLVPLAEVENAQRLEAPADNTVRFPVREEQPLRMAASTETVLGSDFEADMAALGVTVVRK